jgi:hypothetical protein
MVWLVENMAASLSLGKKAAILARKRHEFACPYAYLALGFLALSPQARHYPAIKINVLSNT